MGQIANLFNIILTFPIFNCLIILYHLFGDFGLSILVLTLIIKLILFPLTLQQLKSTKATQALQPQMAEIKKKYAKDQQAQAAALQTLYKEYGVNPLAGCLPLLIQLPVLYGLYFALSTGIKTDKLSDLNAHLYPFVPHFTYVPHFNLDWFTWLSFLNPILHVSWTWALPLNAADPSHVLPIVAGLATFIQLRMSQPKPIIGSDGKAAPVDPTQQSMKMMQYIMPFFTLFIAWNVASGLALYWTISSVFQAVQQYFVTGWGALLTKPNLKSDLAGAGSSASTASTARSSVVESTLANNKSTKGSQTAQNMRTTPKPASAASGTNGASGGSQGGSQYTRRQRGGSASARRRNNAQRAR